MFIFLLMIALILGLLVAQLVTGLMALKYIKQINKKNARSLTALDDQRSY